MASSHPSSVRADRAPGGDRPQTRGRRQACSALAFALLLALTLWHPARAQESAKGAAVPNATPVAKEAAPQATATPKELTPPQRAATTKEAATPKESTPPKDAAAPKASTAPKSAAAPTKDAATAADGARCDRAAFRVVIDVGHTVESPGAVSARGIDEYVFNLRLAKEIERSLVNAGFARTVLMVTGGRARRSLFTRVAHANKSAADLLLSIHHDSVPDKFLETWEYEGSEHPFCDRFKGHSIFISHNNVERTASLQFAHLLGMQLKARGLQYTPHYTEAFMGHRQRVLVDADAGVYRYDELIVLKDTSMPAVLLEAGSIINREEELTLNSEERRALIRAAATDAVVQFCAAHPPHKPEPAIAHATRASAATAAKPRVRPAVAKTSARPAATKPSANAHP